jgi:hypothetical protein
MYGMVNKAIQEMVIRNHGEEVWQKIKRRVGVTTDIFIGIEGYPDEITYKLVAAASELLQTPADRILHAFGEHWVLETAGKGYQHLMNAAGATLKDFLMHLPRFHDRIALIYPNLVPPQFTVVDHSARALRVHYTSHRPGLAPFVEGLISGLGKRFNTPVRITLEQPRKEGGHTDVFFVEW